VYYFVKKVVYTCVLDSVIKWCGVQRKRICRVMFDFIENICQQVVSFQILHVILASKGDKCVASLAYDVRLE
jgi:hypothetical protein